jgi:anti-sigma B factor antagonist
MVLNAEIVDGIGIVSLPERLNSNNCPAFRKDVEPLTQQSARMIFDLTPVKAMDSMALGALVACLKHQRSAGGDVKLYGMSKQIRALFELVRMHHIFDIYNTRQEALDAYRLRGTGESA